MTVCFIVPCSLCLCSCLYTFTSTAFVRNPENMNIVGMLMFKMELWASSAGCPDVGVLLMLISRYSRLIVPLMHKTCWLFCLETKKQEKRKSEEPHVCPLCKPACQLVNCTICNCTGTVKLQVQTISVITVRNTINTELWPSKSHNSCLILDPRVLGTAQDQEKSNGLHTKGHGAMEDKPGGQLQAHCTSHCQVQHIPRWYLRRARQVLRSQLKGRNIFQAINSYTMSVIRYPTGIINWPKVRSHWHRDKLTTQGLGLKNDSGPDQGSTRTGSERER